MISPVVSNCVYKFIVVHVSSCYNNPPSKPIPPPSTAPPKAPGIPSILPPYIEPAAAPHKAPPAAVPNILGLGAVCDPV